ncbi:hypothetical protein JDS78_19765 [Bacillus cereus group sp. N17]|uniref:hypothetical protein n=1 Tax=Bacillus cereus group sp. N17 TaxID=2794589 RepID=UPI0018F28A0D|nr:hypothetical protein [Bacillus cereus group sp. N17]MBJ8042476.1 hypothetical protein [Bacillus cereus group sp. N17]
MYNPHFHWNYYYLPISYPYTTFHSQLYDRNQQYFSSYIPQLYHPPTYFRQEEDILTVPESAKTKKILPIGEEFFVPEFKISQCNIDRINEYFQHGRGFKISMNKVKQEFKNAESSVKEAAKQFNEELNKLIGNNSAEIKRIEWEIKQKTEFLASVGCIRAGINCALMIEEIRELEEKIKSLKNKSFGASLDSARNKFQNSLDELRKNQIPNVNWPESWPNLEDIEYMPVIVNRSLDIPKTLKDMNIDSSLIQNIPIPDDIAITLNLPPDMSFGDIDLASIKNQIQFDDSVHSAQQVLNDLKNKTISELQRYNMCLYIKNSPYSLEVQLEYISDFKKLVEFYIYGCLEKAKKAALLVFVGYIPTIINSYGASIPIAISNSFATFWTTFKKCLFDVYDAFKEEIKTIEDVESFERFLEIIEKYVSIDFTLEKRTVPWENKGSLVDLLSNRSMYINTRQVPFVIDPKEEYVQFLPPYCYMKPEYAFDEESIKKKIVQCGRLGMWIAVTLKEGDSYGNSVCLWLNVRRFEHNILSGYTVTQANGGKKTKRNIDIPIQNIRNLLCHDLSYNALTDLEEDLLVKSYSADICSNNKGILFGKDYIDMSKGILIYYEVYECGVYTRIYINEVVKSELYLPRNKEKIEHVYKHSISPTASDTIVLDIAKEEPQLNNRLRIIIYENVLDDTVNRMFWNIKLPW